MVGILPKRAIIVVTLVKESEKKDKNELEEEILAELSKIPHVIPWMERVLRVEVVDQH